MLSPDRPALVFAPMDGVTDAPMRALQGQVGAFTYAVTEFLRVSQDPISAKVFRRDVPELADGGLTPTGLPVQIQLLGGDPGRMAASAATACQVGARAIDINFGCPAPVVNRHDGGASLLKSPCRLREVVAAVRAAVPPEIPVSAKVRLGWASIDDIDRNAEAVAEGGATWITIHARTRTQGYKPPVFWPKIGQVRTRLGIPVVANGDIWTLDDFRRCQDETGCQHFMIGRGALANPQLPGQIARELGIDRPARISLAWESLFRELVRWIDPHIICRHDVPLMRLKQWSKMAYVFGSFAPYHDVKTAPTVEEFFRALQAWTPPPGAGVGDALGGFPSLV